MPDYEYYCPACAHKFTAHRSMANRNKITGCPKCKYPRCARMASVPGVTYNGSGFYTTDHRGCNKDG